MVRLDYLDPFDIYVTRPPVIMPESKDNRKRDQLYMVIAPSVEDELRYLANTEVLKFRFIGNYFVEKRWEVKLYKQGTKIVKPNSNGEISDLLKQYHKGNLASVSDVTSYLPSYKGNALRRLNTLVEINHVTELMVTKNDVDHRHPRMIAADWIKELLRAMDVQYLGENYSKTVVLPLDLWFNTAEYSNAVELFRLNSKSVMGHFLRELCESKEMLDKVGKLVVVDGVHLMIIDPSALPAKDPGKFLKDKFLRFMKRSTKRTMSVAEIPADASYVSVDQKTDEEDEPGSVTKMAVAEKKTEEDIATEMTLEAIKADPDEVDDSKKKEIKEKIVRKNLGTVAKAPAITQSAGVTITTDAPPVSPEELKKKVEQMPISAEEADVLLAAKMGGRSVASQKRNEMLKTKYKELKFGDTNVESLMEEQEDVSIAPTEVKADTINPALKELKGNRFEEAYDTELYQKDLLSILLHFSNVEPALYLSKDIDIQDVSTSIDRVLRYTVTYEDENRKRHRFSFRLPKMYKHKYLFLNGQELNITHQKLPFPITKVQPDRCQLVTNYNKLFIYRYGTALSPRINRLKKILNGGGHKEIVIRKGDCTALNKSLLTTIEYDEFSGQYVRIQIGTAGNSVTFAFDPELISVMFDMRKKPAQVTAVNSDGKLGTIEDKTLIPLAVRKGRSGSMQYWLSGTTNQVYDDTGKAYGELSDFMIQVILEFVPKLEKELVEAPAGSRFMYSRVHIMDEEIPLIVVMGAADPGGLLGALEKSKINFQFVEKRPTVDKNITGVIPFADGFLVFDRYPYENSLLLNGLSVVNTKEYNFLDMNQRDTYVDIFDDMVGRRTMADNMPAFYWMMIDPITKDVLNHLDMPTDFTTLLHYCNGSLADNSFQIDSNYENSRIRSNEIIMAHLYRELAVAWSNYRSGRTDTFSIPENCVIKLLLTSKIVDPKSKLNITLELENDRNIKLKGPSGMNEDHSFTIEKRAFHPSMKGIVATNSTPSGEVGINRHLVTNVNINDARGFITVDKKDYNGTELLSPGELLQPFGAESADIERLCMSISQAKHLVPVQSQCASPISYDFERVAPYLSNDFAFVAKQDGKVVELKDEVMIVQYKDGTYDDIDLSLHPAKNTDGGFYIMNKMDSRYKVGQSFKKDDILASDQKTFNENDFFGDPCANVGTLARVAFESNGSVFEDSGYITDSFAHRFATRITKQKRVILSKYANIKYIAKIGQEVQANDIILAFDDTEDEFSSQLLASMAEQMGDEDVINATTAPVRTKFTGVIKDIRILYTVPTKEMTKSLAKVVNDYVAEASKREKVIGKYIDIRDSNTIVKTSEMQVPDSQGKVAGTRVDEGVIIDFYIEYEDVAGNGDKGSIGALKFTVCNVVPNELAGFTESNPERKIDVYVSSFGAFKRMVADVEKVGILSKVLVEEKRKIKETYGKKIKDALKNLK